MRVRLPSGAMPVLMTGAMLAGAALARYGNAAAARREKIAHGELRELDAMWTWVDDVCWHARFSTPPGKRDSPTIVLIHGFGASSRYLVPFAERLAVLGDVYAPDLPGHGKTDARDTPLDIAGYADALAAWLDAMELSRVQAIGHSMGSQIAVELALRRPDLVERLVLIGPTIDRSSRNLRGTLPRFITGGFREPLGVGLLLLIDYLRSRRALSAELRSMFRYALEDAIRRVEVPVLLVRGEHDKVAPAAWLEHLARNAPNARVASVPGAAHAVQFSDPDALVRAVRPFLARQQAPVRDVASSASRTA